MSRVRRRVSRLPLRVRLVAGFSAAMLAVLVGAGVFVYWRVAYALDRGLDTELTRAAGTISRFVHADGGVADRSAADATGVAWQVLDRGGSVSAHGGAATDRSLVPASRLARLDDRAETIDVGALLPAATAPYRLLVEPVPDAPGHYLVVGVRRDHRDEALRELLAQLGLAGLGALGVTAFVGDRLARAALRPVERYRRRAAEIARGAHELRLDVPTERDDEVTRLGHTFNEMLAELERSLDRERQFVVDASHELRTPITLLSSRLQLARRRVRTVEEHEHILEDLQVDLDRLARLAEQLLRLGASQAVGTSPAGDLVQAVHRVAEDRGLGRAGTDAEGTVELLASSAPVRLTDLEAERILTNLLDNGRVHGSPPYRVRVDRPDAGWVRLTVADSGPGMPPDLLDDATQRFARAEDARARPGAGLGLSLVDALVAGAGGELRLCHAGRHSRHGARSPVPCEHGPEMVVTVLLAVVEVAALA